MSHNTDVKMSTRVVTPFCFPSLENGSMLIWNAEMDSFPILRLFFCCRFLFPQKCRQMWSRCIHCKLIMSWSLLMSWSSSCLGAVHLVQTCPKLCSSPKGSHWRDVHGTANPISSSWRCEQGCSCCYYPAWTLHRCSEPRLAESRASVQNWGQSLSWLNPLVRPHRSDIPQNDVLLLDAGRCSIC